MSKSRIPSSDLKPSLNPQFIGLIQTRTDITMNSPDFYLIGESAIPYQTP
jgi:hypothetical protein